MPVSVQIIKAHALVYVRNEGVLNMDEQMQSFQDYAAHPDFAPGQKYLIDMRAVLEFHGDHLGASKLLAKVASNIPKTESAVLFVYLANSDISFKLSRTAVNTLTATDDIVARIAETEQKALEILGLPATALNALQDVNS